MSQPLPLHDDWTRERALALFAMPFNDLLFEAQTVHRRHFDANKVQVSTLLSIKTGSCPEDCAYCPQSAHFDTGLEAERLMPLDEVKSFIESEKHLPEVPSAAQVNESGLNITDMQMRLLRKVEELTLYLIELEKRNSELEARLNSLSNK